MASLLKKLGSLMVWMSWVMEMWQLSRAYMNIHVLSWKKCININILLKNNSQVCNILDEDSHLEFMWSTMIVNYHWVWLFLNFKGRNHFSS